jgi:branched-chain amino acid transport system ATP-binding protein
MSGAVMGYAAAHRAEADIVGICRQGWKAEEMQSFQAGRQRQVEIARALIAEPKVLLLDEPSLGLAPSIAEEVRLAEISRGGVTLLIVEQNTTTALAVAARAYVMESGKIVLEGAATELAENPKVREAYLGR